MVRARQRECGASAGVAAEKLSEAGVLLSDRDGEIDMHAHTSTRTRKNGHGQKDAKSNEKYGETPSRKQFLLQSPDES